MYDNKHTFYFYKESAMKEIRNLTIKNDCFNEVAYESLMEEQKNRALSMLILMIMKRNSMINSHRVAN